MEYSYRDKLNQIYIGFQHFIHLKYYPIFLTILVVLIVVIVVNSVWPNLIPFETFEFWRNNRIIEGIKAFWWLSLFGIAVVLITSIYRYNLVRGYTIKKFTKYWLYVKKMPAEKEFVSKSFERVFHGIWEEILFRWLLFFMTIISAQIVDYLLLGFAGFGIVEWIFIYIVRPVMNFISLGKIHWLLYHPAGWFVGLAAISVNQGFATGHVREYKVLGYLSSWFLGFVLFWIIFTYGIVTAIIIHFLYDFFIGIMEYIVLRIERKFLVDRYKFGRAVKIIVKIIEKSRKIKIK